MFVWVVVGGGGGGGVWCVLCEGMGWDGVWVGVVVLGWVGRGGMV